VTAETEPLEETIDVRPLAPEDVGYALSSWRESHKQAPGVDKVPWTYYKKEYGAVFGAILNGAGTALGAYRGNELLGFVVFTPGKRVVSLHWVQVKHKDAAGTRLRRRGLMTMLVDAAELGARCVYTLRGPRRAVEVDGKMTKSLDEALVPWLAKRGVAAAYVPMIEWMRA
jgi:hypothetical protein